MNGHEDRQSSARRAYWRQVSRLTVALLCAWLGVTFIGSWFARDLDQLRLGDFSLGFWMASQGALILYVLIIGAYAWWMDRVEARMQDDPEAPRQDDLHD